MDEEFDKQMVNTIKEYETKHGEIDLNDSKKMSIMYVNKDDAMVWNMLPLTDIQKKFIFIRLYCPTDESIDLSEGQINLIKEEEEPLENSSQPSEI